MVTAHGVVEVEVFCLRKDPAVLSLFTLTLTIPLYGSLEVAAWAGRGFSSAHGIVEGFVYSLSEM
jgi:hypothetical protein